MLVPLRESVPVVDPSAATGVFSLLWVIIALPALGAAVILVLGNRRTARWAHLLGCATILASFVLSVAVFVALLGRSESDRQVGQKLYDWVDAGSFKVQFGLLYDPLTALFLLLITGVGSLIHIYSIGYMEHDERRARFFGYLNLFVASMLTLVLADNYLVVFLGWEGVGLASYLLIGFWQYKPSAAVAAKKAFVVNRVGAIGMALGTMLIFATFGTVTFAGVSAAADRASDVTLTVLGLLLLLAACGKSAQVPLQSWLLDAMEGPTPVSALIHAATMVTAGVYLIARSHPIFDVSVDARTAVEIVGAVTLVVGAIIGCAYDDIKKVLAASTMSQIGYMMLAVGLGPGAYAIGIMHLLTHGFFKANMFLGAGSVMHGMNDEVNMRRYGGLRKVMPVTFFTFAAGYLAIIGVPPFAGFFSKDKIIEAALDKGGAEGWILGLVALVGAGLTAFYMSRLMIMTFLGNRRWSKDAHPHESPRVMTVPMTVLAVGSLVAGFLLVLGASLQHFLAPSVGPSVEEGAHTMAPAVLTALTLLVVAGGVAAAWWLVYRKPVPVEQPLNVTQLTWAARRSLYGDALNESLFMRPGAYLTRALVFFDGRGVDGAVNGLAALVGGTSGRVRRTQTGFARSYALSMLVGALVISAALFVVRAG